MSSPCPQCGDPDPVLGALYRTERSSEVFDAGGERHHHPTQALRQYWCAKCSDGYGWTERVDFPCPATNCEHVTLAEVSS